MDAEDWLKGVEKKLVIAQYTDHEKVLFVVHQLYGTAANWWETYCNTHVNPRPYKSHPKDPQSTPHLTVLLPSPLPRRNASPPSFSDRHRAAATPVRHTAARAPVSRQPHSPCPTPPLPPLGRRPWTLEWPEAEAPVSPVLPSTAGPPWTRIPVVHDPVDPVYGKFFMKIIR
jgi:hypothetical protein